VEDSSLDRSAALDHLVDDPDFTLYVGDVSEVLAQLPDESVHCVVTSPPYWGLRDYGVDGQIGLEPTPEEYVARMVAVFGEVRRVLRRDGTCWLNIGDSYASVPGSQSQGENGQMADRSVVRARAQVRDGKAAAGMGAPSRPPGVPGIKPKDLVGIPWRLAFALQADGWYLRSDIIWAKPNPMPESVTDRPTKAHEYVFLLTRSARYFYDADAIREPYQPSSVERDAYGYNHAFANQFKGSPTDGRHPDGKVLPPGSFAKGPDGRKLTTITPGPGSHDDYQTGTRERWPNASGRNRRSVWEIATEPYPDAHFATFPQALVEPCVKAGCPEGGVVLDPFMGSGTTALVARRLGRRSIGIELNETYAALAAKRLSQLSLLAEPAA